MTAYIVDVFNYKDASREDYQKLLDLRIAMREERSPGDPQPTLDEFITNFQSVPPFVVLQVVVAWTPDRTQAAAELEVSFTLTEDNKNLVGFNLDVHRNHRQHGLAAALLKYVVAFAQEHNRTLLITDTDSAIPAGELLMEKMGAMLGLESKTNRLQMADLDPALMRTWVAEAQEKATDFTLGLWEGQIPEEDLQDYMGIIEVMNTAPRGSLQLEDWHPTAEEVRQEEASMLAQGVERWTLYVRHVPSGEVAGFTETYYRPTRPQRIGQGATGVLPKYRNHGLGRWLKGAMMLKVLVERPQVKFVDTGNADSNAPMLKINHEMGFKPHLSHKVWQFTVEQAEAYLAARPGGSV